MSIAWSSFVMNEMFMINDNVSPRNKCLVCLDMHECRVLECCGNYLCHECWMKCYNVSPMCPRCCTKTFHDSDDRRPAYVTNFRYMRIEGGSVSLPVL